MKSRVILAVIVGLFSGAAIAANNTSCEHGGACPGQGGDGGNAAASASSGSVSVSSAGAIAGSSSKASANPVAVAVGGEANGGTATASGNGGSASTGSVSNSVTTGNVRSLSLGAAAVGSPAADTCAAHFAVGFGLLTVPVQMESCTALQQAILLDHWGLRDAAIARLCQLKEIAETGICPPKVKAE